MATSTLTSLPTELLDEIITHTLPEGFEGLALTCRSFYNLCTPLIKRHNQRRTLFREFTYHNYPNRGLLEGCSPPAIFLIQEIAHDPIVARYIRHADFTYDTWPPRPRDVEYLPSPDLGGPVVDLFAESPYLRAAGLDWREFYACIQVDLQGHDRYSQHAAAFLLTLMPNVTSLNLPCLWQPCEMADKLIHAIAHRAVNMPSPCSSLWDSPSLAQVTEFEPCSEEAPIGLNIHYFTQRGFSRYGFNLADAVPFLALPKLRSFGARHCVIRDRARSCAVRDGDYIETAYENAGFPYGDNLVAAHFSGSFLDDVAMASFLRRTPNLKELSYWHSTEWQTTQVWDVCRLVRAIERESGSYLESLEIGSIYREPLVAGRLSMHGFQRLRKLRLPLELASLNLNADVSFRNKEPTDEDLRGLQGLTDILVPASVSELSLDSRFLDRNIKALRIMFWDFAARKEDWVPALQKIRLSPRPKYHSDAYQDAVRKLEVETKEAGVILHLRPFLEEDEDEDEH